MIGRRAKQGIVPSVPAAVAIATDPPEVKRAAQVEAELADARRDLATAEAEAVAAAAAYERAADAGQLSEAVAAKRRGEEAVTEADIAGRRVTRLNAELKALLQGAADAAAAAERDELRAAAEQALAAYEEAFRTDMPTITASVRMLIRMWAQAEQAREAAARKGVELPAADAFRHVPGSTRVEISRREVDLWINPHGNGPFGDEDQAKIKVRSDGVGTLQGQTYLHETILKRRFAEITFRPWSVGQLAPALFEAVLPCLTADGPAGWSPLKHGASPQAVLAALDALEARELAPRPDPEVRTERVPIEPARDVRLNPDPAPQREWLGPYGGMGEMPADEQTDDP